MLYGHELLGAAKYAKEAIRLLPRGRAGKAFHDTFGNAVPVFVGWAKKGIPVIASQGAWAGASHDYSGAAMLKRVIKNCKEFNSVAADYPHLSFHYSPFCEHKEDKAYMLKVMQELQPYANHLILVNNPMMGGALLPGFYNETHGSWKPNVKNLVYDWACDGLSAVDCDIEHFKKHHTAQGAKIIWLWIPQYNCKKKIDEETPIPQRKVRPTEKQIISVDYLCYPKGEVKLNDKWLYKSHGDQHGDIATGREGKPVIICPVSGDEIQLVGKNGKVICTFPRNGNYTDGRPLYRSPLWGYEIQERAKKLGGAPTVSVRLNGKRYGTVNPAFRQNFYRN